MQNFNKGLITLLIMLVVMGGCTQSAARKEYLESQVLPELIIPNDLEKPRYSGYLKIPNQKIEILREAKKVYDPSIELPPDLLNEN